MPDHQHNSDKFGCSWGNLDMMKGLAKGTLISDTGAVGGWSWRGDANGGGVYSYDPDKSGSLTFQVETANLLHLQLVTLFNTDDVGRNVFNDISVSNNDTGEKRVFHNARIQRVPPFGLATESEIAPWVFLYTGTTYAPNLNQSNVLGSGVAPVLPAEP